MVKAVAQLDWRWNGEENCWQMTLERQGCYVKRFMWREQVVWYTRRIGFSVSSFADGRDLLRKACASSYATELVALEDDIKAHLVGRSVRVYGGGSVGDAWDARLKDEVLREPADAIALDLGKTVHPDTISVEIDSIMMLDPQRPTRVHIAVETCYPDPYFCYTVVFEGRVIVDAYGDLR